MKNRDDDNFAGAPAKLKEMSQWRERLSQQSMRLRHGDDQGTIGLILCKTHDRPVAEYALRDQRAPMGIATYRVAQTLPEALKPGLPDIEEIETRLMANTGLTAQGQDMTDTTE